MGRRQHVTLAALQKDVEPPAETESIVKAVGSRGGNIMEVEYPDGSRTLCIIPAKFHKKLWIRSGNYLLVEANQDIDAAISGQVTRVLYNDHVKQLQKIPGAWPEAFRLEATSQDQKHADTHSDSEHGSDSDDGLPPLERINNRRVVAYMVDDSESEEDQH